MYERWVALVEAGQIAMCPVVALELLWSARSPKEFRELTFELRDLIAKGATRRRLVVTGSEGRPEGLPTRRCRAVQAADAASGDVALNELWHDSSCPELVGPESISGFSDRSDDGFAQGWSPARIPAQVQTASSTLISGTPGT